MKTGIVMILCLCILHIDGAEKIRVACIGNSITAGYGINDVNSHYPTRLQKLLGTGYEVQNEGVSGTTMLKKGDNPYWKNGKLGQTFAFKPNIVTIKLGTNDTKPQNWDSHHDEFKDDYLSMVDTLASLSTKPEIFLVLPVPVFKTNWGINDSVLQQVITITKTIATERNLPLIDANTPLQAFGHYFSDGIHPNAAGADSIAHIIYRALVAATPNLRCYPMQLLTSTKDRIVAPWGTMIFFSGGPIYSGSGVLFDPAGRRVPCLGGGHIRVRPVGTGVYFRKP